MLKGEKKAKDHKTQHVEARNCKTQQPTKQTESDTEHNPLMCISNFERANTIYIIF